ncbi:MAG: metallophosphoesterase [Bacteroidota bacterium]
MSHRWVIGDIHGCINTFRKMVEDEISPFKDEIIYILGDLIDRGIDSKAVLDYILYLMDKSVDVRVIRGNHEVMLLEAGRSEEQFTLWMRNGGFTTLNDFGIVMDLSTGPEAASCIPPVYTEFFNGLPWYLETEGFFLVHAGLNTVSSDPLSDTETMIWTRQKGYNASFLKGRKLVHGHSPEFLEVILDQFQNQDSLVYNLDGGCVYSNYPGLGNLIAWNLDTGMIKIVPNRE